MCMPRIRINGINYYLSLNHSTTFISTCHDRAGAYIEAKKGRFGTTWVAM